MSNGFKRLMDPPKPVEVIPQLHYKDCKLPLMTFLGPLVPTGARSHKPASLRTTR
jgi:hypothetical protein